MHAQHKIFFVQVFSLLALISTTFVTSNKFIHFAGVKVNVMIFSAAITLLSIISSDRIQGRDVASLLFRVLFICSLLNMVFLLALLAAPSSHQQQAQIFQDAYTSIYSVQNIIKGLFYTFLPSYLYLSLKCKFKKSSIRSGFFELPPQLVMLITICTTLLINSHSICYKFVELPLIGSVAASGIIFSCTFLLADVVAEYYGYAASRVLICATLGTQVLFLIFVYSANKFLISDNVELDVYYNILFGKLIVRQFCAATISVFLAYFVFSFLISAIKTNLQNKRFWLRTFIASCSGQAILCIFSYMILYYDQYKLSIIWTIIWHTWLFKMTVLGFGTTLVTVPLIYYIKMIDRSRSTGTDAAQLKGLS